MPETRYIENYEYPEELSAEERVPENAIITQIPYEVSDEQLAEEAEQARDLGAEIDEIKAKLAAPVSKYAVTNISVDPQTGKLTVKYDDTPVE